jgi:hypothetical protein
MPVDPDWKSSRDKALQKLSEGATGGRQQFSRSVDVPSKPVASAPSRAEKIAAKTAKLQQDEEVDEDADTDEDSEEEDDAVVELKKKATLKEEAVEEEEEEEDEDEDNDDDDDDSSESSDDDDGNIGGSIHSPVSSPSKRALSSFDPFLRWLLAAKSLRLGSYRFVKPELRARFEARMRALGHHNATFDEEGRPGPKLYDYAGYAQRLLAVANEERASDSEWVELDSVLLIDISRFFRDGKMWQYMISTMLPTAVQAARVEAKAKEEEEKAMADGKEGVNGKEGEGQGGSGKRKMSFLEQMMDDEKKKKKAEEKEAAKKKKAESEMEGNAEGKGVKDGEKEETVDYDDDAAIPASEGEVRAWVMGAANGEEVYSLTTAYKLGIDHFRRQVGQSPTVLPLSFTPYLTILFTSLYSAPHYTLYRTVLFTALYSLPHYTPYLTILRTSLYSIPHYTLYLTILHTPLQIQIQRFKYRQHRLPGEFPSLGLLEALVATAAEVLVQALAQGWAPCRGYEW